MAEEQEKVKIELELPKSEVHIEPVKPKPDEHKELQHKHKESEKSEDVTLGGYVASDIVKAPLEVPKPKDKRPPNQHQLKVMFFGLILVLVGLLAWPVFNASIAIAIAIAGAATIAFGTFIRV
jgi:CHASE2 domain-containing sensor protein